MSASVRAGTRGSGDAAAAGRSDLPSPRTGAPVRAVGYSRPMAFVGLYRSPTLGTCAVVRDEEQRERVLPVDRVGPLCADCCDDVALGKRRLRASCRWCELIRASWSERMGKGASG